MAASCEGRAPTGPPLPARGARRSGGKTERPLSPAIIMGFGGLLLMAGLAGGLGRLGWIPAPGETAGFHGALMVSGFLGTLIGLERASTMANPAFMAVPALAAAGGLATAAGLSPSWSGALWAAAAAGMVYMFYRLYCIQPGLHGAVITAGAICWLAAGLLWAARFPLTQVVPWWAAFLILVIVGERLELTRVRRPSPGAVRALLTALGFMGAGLIAGLIVSIAFPGAGLRIFGGALAAQAIWLLAEDIIWYTIHRPEPTRFIAICLLAGYIWLGIGGLFWLLSGPHLGGPMNDATLHAVFLGFVMSMIFGHSLIIFPGVLGIPIQFSGRFYIHLVLLHLSLVARTFGNLVGSAPLVRWGGLLNVSPVILFLLSAIVPALFNLKDFNDPQTN